MPTPRTRAQAAFLSAESRDLLSLDIGLTVSEVEPVLREVLGKAGNDGAAGTRKHELSAVNRRGKAVHLHIAASPMRTEEGGVSGIILVIDQQAPQPARS
jgi:hypothetical protein